MSEARPTGTVAPSPAGVPADAPSRGDGPPPLRERRTPTARLIAAFLAGCMAFGYPLLAVFNVADTVLGVPVLYAYLFGAWATLIAAVAAAAPRGD